MPLSARDHQIIQTIAQSRALTEDHLVSWFPSERTRAGTKSSGQYLKRTVLPKLAKEEYIIRTKVDDTYLYTLGKLGAELLRENGVEFYGCGYDDRKEITNWKAEARTLARGMGKDGQTPHVLMRAEVQRKVRQGLAGTPILHWYYDQERIYDVEIPADFSSTIYTLKVDDEIHIASEYALDGHRIIHLESELNSKSESRFKAKIEAQYWHWRNNWKWSTFDDEGSVTKEKLIIEYQWWFPNEGMRTKYEEIAEGVIEKMSRVPKGRRLFCFRAIR